MSKVRKNVEPRGRSRAVGLTDVLRVLPDKELESVVERLGIHIDPAKRIDVPSQIARALVATPEMRDLSHFPSQTRELLHRIAEAKGVLFAPSLPASVEPLVARGIVYARGTKDGVELNLRDFRDIARKLRDDYGIETIEYDRKGVVKSWSTRRV